MELKRTPTTRRTQRDHTPLVQGAYSRWEADLTRAEAKEERGALWLTNADDEIDDTAELTEGTCLGADDTDTGDIRQLCRMEWSTLVEFARSIRNLIVERMEPGPISAVLNKHWIGVFKMLIECRRRRPMSGESLENLDRSIIQFTKDTTMKLLEGARDSETMPGRYDKLILVSYTLRAFRAEQPTADPHALARVTNGGRGKRRGDDDLEAEYTTTELPSDAVELTKLAGVRSELDGKRRKKTGVMGLQELLGRGFAMDFDPSSFMTSRTMTTKERTEIRERLRDSYETAIRGGHSNGALEQADAMCAVDGLHEYSPILAWGATGDDGINHRILNPIVVGAGMDRKIGLEALRRKYENLPVLSRRERLEAQNRIRQRVMAERASGRMMNYL